MVRNHFRTLLGVANSATTFETSIFARAKSGLFPCIPHRFHASRHPPRIGHRPANPVGRLDAPAAVWDAAGMEKPIAKTTMNESTGRAPIYRVQTGDGCWYRISVGGLPPSDPGQKASAACSSPSCLDTSTSPPMT